MFRRYKFVWTVSIVCVLPLSGCIYFFHHSSTIVDPLSIATRTSSVFQSDAEDSANEFCADFKDKQKGMILRQENLLCLKATQALQKVIYAHRRYGALHDLFPASDLWRKQPDVKIVVIASSTPAAQSYPNGEIHLSRILLDSETGCGVQNEAQLVGLVAHEFFHVVQGHTAYQWAANDAYKSFQKKQFWVNTTGLNPFFSRSIYSCKDLSEVHDGPFVVEYLADCATVMLLENMAYDPKEYLHFLEKHRLYAKEKNITEKIGWLDSRITCLKALLVSSQDTLPKYFVIQSTGVSRHYLTLHQVGQSPELMKMVVMWCHVLTNLGRPPPRWAALK